MGNKIDWAKMEYMVFMGIRQNIKDKMFIILIKAKRNRSYVR